MYIDYAPFLKYPIILLGILFSFSSHVISLKLLSVISSACLMTSVTAPPVNLYANPNFDASLDGWSTYYVAQGEGFNWVDGEAHVGITEGGPAWCA